MEKFISSFPKRDLVKAYQSPMSCLSMPLSDLLKKLQINWTQFPKCIHVTGTNGKGSVVAFLRALLESSGHDIHQFISPHLQSFYERIIHYGQPISEELFTDFMQRCVDAQIPVSFFEALTASAFMAFQGDSAPWALIEVGMGGRWDSTNTLPPSVIKASVITPISMDHEAILGPGLQDIAFQKAGIMKPGVPCIIGPQPPEAERVLEACAAETGTPLWRFGKEWSITPLPDKTFLWQDLTTGNTLHAPQPSLVGHHQYYNAGISITVLQALGLLKTKEDLGAITQARWPGRLDPLRNGVWDAYFPDPWVDGAHNVAGAQALATYLKQEDPCGKTLCILMIQSHKNNRAIWDILAPLAAEVWTIEVGCPQSDFLEAHWTTNEVFAQYAQETQTPHRAFSTLDDVLTYAQVSPIKANFTKTLFCGSLYFAAQVLEKQKKF